MIDPIMALYVVLGVWLLLATIALILTPKGINPDPELWSVAAEIDPEKAVNAWREQSQRYKATPRYAAPIGGGYSALGWGCRLVLLLFLWLLLAGVQPPDNVPGLFAVGALAAFIILPIQVFYVVSEQRGEARSATDVLEGQLTEIKLKLRQEAKEIEDRLEEERKKTKRQRAKRT